MRTFTDRIITDEALEKRMLDARRVRQEEIDDGRDSSNDWNDPDSVALICEELLYLRKAKRSSQEPNYLKLNVMDQEYLEDHSRWIQELLKKKA